MPNTIIRKAYLNIYDQIVATAVAITPGMLLERDSAGLVQAHSLAGGPVAPLFALEDDKQGKKTTDDYAVSVPIFTWRPVPGEQVEAIVESSAEPISIGDFVESAGDGTIRRTQTQTSAGISEFAQSLVGVALEAGVSDARIVIEIM